MIATTPTVEDVRIVVSCHKPSFIPESRLYLPVHVGAARAECELSGCQRDDEGENISELNPLLCELTAQYWAWKNLDAAFIGACHYRRYFCLNGTAYAANDHAQIERPKLNDATVKEFGLVDEEMILTAVGEADAIVPETWSVVGVPTPRGPQESIAEHMKAYGLLDDGDLEVLDRIVAERRPEYLQDLRDYLAGDSYTGYNCFVLRKPLFDRLNEFEFSVLLPFIEEYDRLGLIDSSARLCGYLGEILFSVFVMRLRREGVARIEEAPLVFFFDVDPSDASPEPVRGAGIVRKLLPFGTRRGTIARKVASKIKAVR